MSETRAASSPARLAWLDYAKAIGISLVVFAHVSWSIDRTNGLVWSDTLRSLDSVIYAFHMPLFFLVSGYLSGLRKDQESSSFASSLVWGIAYPYLLWSVIWIALKMALPGAANVALPANALGSILWRPVEHFWFLYHLFFIRLSWQLIAWTNTRAREFVLAGTLGVSALVWFGFALNGSNPPVAAFALNFLLFGLGYCRLQPFLERWTTSAPVTAGVLALALIGAGKGLGVPASTLLFAIGGSLIVLAIALMLPAPTTPVWRLIALIGEASLAIYVLHLLVSAVLRSILSSTGLLTETSLLFSATLAGIAAPLCLYVAALTASQHLNWPIAKFAGFGLVKRSHYLPLKTIEGSLATNRISVSKR